MVHFYFKIPRNATAMCEKINMCFALQITKKMGGAFTPLKTKT